VINARRTADMRASRCLVKSLSARAELAILSCNGMHVIVLCSPLMAACVRGEAGRPYCQDAHPLALSLSLPAPVM